MEGDNVAIIVFQHTAARRRLQAKGYAITWNWQVSTHSRTKAAAATTQLISAALSVSTHSRTKAAAGFIAHVHRTWHVSTHSRTKAAAKSACNAATCSTGFNTQPHEGGCTIAENTSENQYRVSTHSRTKAAARTLFNNAQFRTFQHTAARRRLPSLQICLNIFWQSFNTQPHEGGCKRIYYGI